MKFATILTLSIAATGVVATEAVAQQYNGSNAGTSTTQTWGETRTVANINVHNTSNGTLNFVEGSDSRAYTNQRSDKNGVWQGSGSNTTSFSRAAGTESYKNSEIGTIRSTTEAEFDSLDQFSSSR